MRQLVRVGTVLIHEGEEIDSLYVVLDGRFSVCTAAMNDKEIAPLFSAREFPVAPRFPFAEP